jgi:hypothetical protein
MPEQERGVERSGGLREETHTEALTTFHPLGRKED